ncbi:MAG TPA: hypothetical protein VN604_07085 [Nitrospirota bacterium]|nr:hypothetical protein [Nitrospirota bacterium]
MDRTYYQSFAPGKRLFFLVMGVLLASLTACVSGISLYTRPSQSGGLQDGTYTLFLYGCSNNQSIENTVILAPEGGKHLLSVHGPEFEYKIRKGLPAGEALREAEQFLRCSVYYRKTQLRNITDTAGSIIGYELRPLYSYIDFGTEDVLLVDYRQMQDARVVVYIRLDPRIQRQIDHDGKPLLHDGGGKDGK